MLAESVKLVYCSCHCILRMILLDIVQSAIVCMSHAWHRAIPLDASIWSNCPGTLHHRYSSYSMGVGILAVITLSTGALVATFPLVPQPGPELQLSKRTSDVALLIEACKENAEIPPSKRARNSRLAA